MTWPSLGTLSIYRAPGSVAFLNCGSALQPILPKSQCWCIDEASATFVLQIRRPNYWRIELGISKDEQRNPVGLRDVLSNILQFEKTYCPFQRSFTVDIPEAPLVSVKKKAWSPKRVCNTPYSIDVPAKTADGMPRADHASGSGPAVAEGTIIVHDLPQHPAPVDKSERSTLETCHTGDIFFNREQLRTNLSVREGLAPTQLDALQLLGDNSEPDTVGLGKQSTTTDSMKDTQSYLTGAAIHPYSEVASPSQSTQRTSSSGRQPRVFSPDHLGQEDGLLGIRSSVNLDPMTELCSSVDSAACESFTPYASTVMVSSGNPGPLDNEARGRVSPALSQDSFHSVDSRYSPLSTTTDQVFRSPEQCIALDKKRDDADPKSPDTQGHLTRPGERSDSRRLLNSDLFKNAPLTMVAKTSELILGPPAYLIALMVKIAARISRGGWTSPSPTYNYSDNDAPVFYDSSDSDLTE